MDRIDVAIIGAGPYGLSMAAHLRAKNVPYRQFGIPMRLWRASMPKGMYLKSRPFASNLSDPAASHTLEDFCKATGRSYEPAGLPVPLETFAAYGQWFQSDLGLEVEESLVSGVVRRDDGFELTAGGEQVIARNVIVAIGVEHFAHIPGVLSELPKELCTHSSAHADPAAFRDREVIIIGAGQSALELAGLAHENGAKVTVVARHGVFWSAEEKQLPAPLLQRAKSPAGGLGNGWRLWAYASLPHLFRLLPSDIRVSKAWTVLGPAGAGWLRDRVEGQLPILTGHTVKWAKSAGGAVHLGGTEPGGTSFELAAEHVVAATGYRVELSRLTFLSEPIRSGLRTIGSSAAVGRDYQSSIAGLYFIGPAAAASFGPVMRFVYGSRHPAATVAWPAAGSRSASQPAAA